MTLSLFARCLCANIVRPFSVCVSAADCSLKQCLHVCVCVCSLCNRNRLARFAARATNSQTHTHTHTRFECQANARTGPVQLDKSSAKSSSVSDRLTVFCAYIAAKPPAHVIIERGSPRSDGRAPQYSISAPWRKC